MNRIEIKADCRPIVVLNKYEYKRHAKSLTRFGYRVLRSRKMPKISGRVG